VKFLTTAACFFLLGTIAARMENRAAQVPAEQQIPFAQQQAQVQKTPEATAEPQTKIDPVKEADIQKLLDAMGAEELVTQTMGNTEKTIRPLLVNTLPPGEYRDKLIDLFLAKLLSKLDVRKVAELSVPVYDKYFSDAEVKDLTSFYATPSGRKYLSVLPAMMAELQEKGRKMGEEAGRQAMVEVMAEHPELAQSLKDAVAKAKQQ
jgi:uncharacterized protein